MENKAAQSSVCVCKLCKYNLKILDSISAAAAWDLFCILEYNVDVELREKNIWTVKKKGQMESGKRSLRYYSNYGSYIVN